MPAAMLAASAGQGRSLDNALTAPLIIPVAVAAFLGGVGPGLVATMTAALACGVLLRYSLHPDDVSLAIMRWAAFLIVGCLVSVLTESLRRSRRHA